MNFAAGWVIKIQTLGNCYSLFSRDTLKWLYQCNWWCLPSVCVQHCPLNSCLQLHPPKVGVPPLAQFPWLQARVSTSTGHGDPPHDESTVTVRARSCPAPVPQGWLQALHELQELTTQFLIMHDDDLRLIVHDEASATTASTKNGQNSFDVISSMKLQSSKGNHINCTVGANHPKTKIVLNSQREYEEEAIF